MKIKLSLSLRRALLSALVTLAPLTSEARIWTMDDPKNNEKYSGSIIDKTFSNEDKDTNENHSYYQAFVEGGAAIAIVNITTEEAPLDYVDRAYRYDLFENLTFSNNTYTLDAGYYAGGGAVLLASSIIGLEDESTQGQKLGIHDSNFTGNTLKSTTLPDSKLINLYGGALALIENVHWSANVATESTNGKGLDTYIHEIKNTTFTLNRIETYDSGLGGAIGIEDMNSYNAHSIIIKNGIIGCDFRYNSITQLPGAKESSTNAGGAIGISAGYVETIYSNFQGNSVLSINDSRAMGGAIALITDEKTEVVNLGIHFSGNESDPILHSTFTSNHATAMVGAAAGGAISIGDVSDALLHVGGVFKNNYVIGTESASGGAIFTMQTPQKSISGEFENNQVVGKVIGFGGAVILDTSPLTTDKGEIENIVASFSGNIISNRLSINSSTMGYDELSQGRGGAFYIKSQNITGNFVTAMDSNSITANEGTGGALYLNESTIAHMFQFNATSDLDNIMSTAVREYDASLPGIFTNNSILAKNLALGGALYAYKSTIDSLSGDISGNFIETTESSANAYGGALYLLDSNIEDMTAEISGNSITGYTAYGGAISLQDESKIGNITGSIVNNTINLQKHNGIDGKGAAIYNENSEVHISTYRADVEISGNYILQSDGTKRYEAIYNTATSENRSAVLSFDLAIKADDLGDGDHGITNEELRFDIRVDDAITGSKEFVDQQYIYINPNDNGYGVGNFYLGNTISNHTITINNGTIEMVESQSEIGARGKLVNSHLILNGSNARFDLAVNSIDSDSKITINSGILDISSSSVQLQSIKNDSFVLQSDNVILDAFLSSSHTNRDDVGVWRIGSPNIQDPSIDQAHRLTIKEGSMVTTGSDGSTVIGAQKFEMSHDFNVSTQNLSQITFESAAELKALVDNNSIFFHLDIKDFAQQHLSNEYTEYWNWTFASWEGSGGITEDDVAYISSTLLTLSQPDELPSNSDKYYIVLQNNSLTLTNSSTTQRSADAKYELIEPGFFIDKGAVYLSSFDTDSASLSAEKRIMYFKDTLGDNLYETSPDAVHKALAWDIDTNGQRYLKVLGEDDGLRFDAFYAYGLGESGRPTNSTVTGSYVAIDTAAYVFNNSTLDITFMDSDFVANTSNSAVLHNDSRIQRLDGDFVGNTVETIAFKELNSGAIRNNARMDTINGDFINNRIISLQDDASERHLHGGALFNLGAIETINGDFVANYAFSVALYSKGGAISNEGASASIGTLNSSFYSNYARSSMVAHGGAIYENNSKGISHINGYFDGNYALATISSKEADLHAAGGAIYRKDSQAESSYSADFIANYAKAQSAGTEDISIAFNAAGGAIFNEGGTGAIKSIDGNFYGNYVMSHNAKGSAAAGIRLSAKGGAIANINAQIGNISGDFIANYTKSFIENSINTSGIYAYGGAIYNENGSIGLLAQDRSISFEGNRTMSHALYNYNFEDGILPVLIDVDEFNAIYNGYNGIMRFNAYGQNKITVNDGINGHYEAGGANILEINSGIDGMGASIEANGKSFSLVEFNNEVEYQTINVHGGTLRLGSYTGKTFTMADGESFETEDSIGLLVASTLNIYEGARVEAKGENLGDNNIVTVEKGTLALAGGTLSNNVGLKGGLIEISDTLTLSGSSIIRTLEDSGASYITGLTNTRSMTSQSLIGSALTSSKIEVQANSSLTLSNLSLSSILIDTTAGGSLIMNSIVYDCSNMEMSVKANEQGILRNSKLTGITVSAKEHIDSPTGGTFNQPMDVYTLTELDVLNFVNVEGSLIFDLDNLHDFDPDAFTAFRLMGVSGVSTWHGSIYLLINDISYQVLGMTNNGIAGISDVYLYIPEPSTATLSLLALAGLLSRRRRKAA